uniref:Uncharacterized protein n=1 Tax=Ditylenchus dipsaci TaxID=166011 RepID=A0A915E1D2_9BILA
MALKLKVAEMSKTRIKPLRSRCSSTPEIVATMMDPVNVRIQNEVVLKTTPVETTESGHVLHVNLVETNPVVDVASAENTQNSVLNDNPARLQPSQQKIAKSVPVADVTQSHVNPVAFPQLDPATNLVADPDKNPDVIEVSVKSNPDVIVYPDKNPDLVKESVKDYPVETGDPERFDLRLENCFELALDLIHLLAGLSTTGRELCTVDISWLHWRLAPAYYRLETGLAKRNHLIAAALRRRSFAFAGLR